MIKKIKSTYGGYSDIVAFMVITILMYIFTYTILFSPMYFSDKRITEEYISLAKDMVCREPGKIKEVDEFLSSKLDVLYGRENYNVQYFIKDLKGDTILLTDFTSQKYFRGDLLTIIVQRNNKSYFENAIGKSFSRIVAKEGMIEADSY